MLKHAGFEMRDVESLREHYVTTPHAWVANPANSWSDAVGLVGKARARISRRYTAASANGFVEGWLALCQVLSVRATEQGAVACQRRASWS
ncbi:MAG: SAM-dependent methyltransferase [Acidimicrobiaceae bacterium]|nr:SAM-dependent methyltransferase [Acidimicrobiaceae bacterium]